MAQAAPFFCISIKHVNIANTQRLWGIWIKVKKAVRFVYELSSFALLLMSFEKAFKLRTWSVVKTWQIARLAEKLPRLLRTMEKTFATA